MYDNYFGDSDGYAGREVLDRAYALGVASVCDSPDEAAHDDLKENSPDEYDESLIELAYEEGRASALEIEGDIEDDEIWEQLVESTLGGNYAADDSESSGTEVVVPERLRRETSADAIEGVPERLELPSFLRR